MSVGREVEMEDGQHAEDGIGVELASAGRALVFLRSELAGLDRQSAAAQLYMALIEALERVYRLQRSD